MKNNETLKNSDVITKTEQENYSAQNEVKANSNAGRIEKSAKKNQTIPSISAWAGSHFLFSKLA